MTCDELKALLHPYLDDELDAGDAASVAAHLDTCPDCAEIYAELKTLSESVAREAKYFSAPPELALRISAALSGPKSARRVMYMPRQWWAIAAAFIAVAILSAGLTSYLMTPSDEDAVEQQIIAGHVRSLMVNHLTDIATSDQDAVKPWFNGKMDAAPPVRDFAEKGFMLVGGRLDYIDGHAVAALVYRHEQHVINVFVWPEPDEPAVEPDYRERQGYNLVYWCKHGTEFWAISDLNRDDLASFQTMFGAIEG